MCSEASPRVSFSHDLGGQADGVVVVPRRDTTLLDMNSDFEFNIASISEQESCSADELFANGFILPVRFRNTSKQVQKCAAPPTASSSSLPPLPRPSHENSKKYFQTIMEVNNKDNLEEEEKPSQSKSFWGFKRSSSLNYDANKKSSKRSLSIFSRSNSTGSLLHKDLENNKPHRSQKGSPSASSTSHLYQKKKNYVNGVKVSPVLNLPPPYISKGTANLFGLLRSNNGSKDKKNKK